MTPTHGRLGCIACKYAFLCILFFSGPLRSVCLDDPFLSRHVSFFWTPGSLRNCLQLLCPLHSGYSLRIARVDRHLTLGSVMCRTRQGEQLLKKRNDRRPKQKTDSLGGEKRPGAAVTAPARKQERPGDTCARVQDGASYVVGSKLCSIPSVSQITRAWPALSLPLSLS